MKAIFLWLMSFAVVLGAVATVLELGSMTYVRHRHLCDSSIQSCYQSYFDPAHVVKSLHGSDLISPHHYFGFVNGLHVPILRSLTNERAVLGSNAVAHDEFRVAVFGGSVALDFAINAGAYFSDRLQQEIPALRNRNVQIFPMAVLFGKQPQQFLLSSFYGDQFDLAINIDGYNEDNADPEDPTLPLLYWTTARPLRFSDFPFMAVRSLMLGLNKSGEQVPLLQRSSLYYLLEKTVNDYWLVAFGASFSEPLTDAALRANLENYHRFTKMQFAVLHSEGVPSLYFIQPNQYYSNSKIPSAEEAKYFFPRGHPVAVRKDSWFHAIHAGLADLRKSGVPAFGLEGIFSSERRTVYTDGCCHLNELGNHILADALVARIAHSLPAHLIGRARP
ncbi:MAG: hypothetical protein ACXVB9_00735 [Bdellovibrionota bacterium]